MKIKTEYFHEPIIMKLKTEYQKEILNYSKKKKKSSRHGNEEFLDLQTGGLAAAVNIKKYQIYLKKKLNDSKKKIGLPLNVKTIMKITLINTLINVTLIP